MSTSVSIDDVVASLRGVIDDLEEVARDSSGDECDCDGCAYWDDDVDSELTPLTKELAESVRDLHDQEGHEGLMQWCRLQACRKAHELLRLELA